MKKERTTNMTNQFFYISLVVLPAWTELLLLCLPGGFGKNASLYNTPPTCYLAEVKTMRFVGAK